MTVLMATEDVCLAPLKSSLKTPSASEAEATLDGTTEEVALQSSTVTVTSSAVRFHLADARSEKRRMAVKAVVSEVFMLICTDRKTLSLDRVCKFCKSKLCAVI